MITNGLTPAVNKPTRICNSSATLIDNVFTNFDNTDCKSAILYSDISDHLPIFLKHVKRNETRQISQSKVSSKLVIDINDKNIFNLKKLLTNADWDPVYNKLRLDDTCQAFKLFLDIIRKAIDETCRAVKSKKTGSKAITAA